MGNQFRLTGRSRLLTLIIGAAIPGIIILAVISGVIQKWLWMQQGEEMSYEYRGPNNS